MKKLKMFSFVTILIFCLTELSIGQNCIKCYNSTLDQCKIQSEDQITSNYLTYTFQIPYLQDHAYDQIYNKKIFNLYQDTDQKQINNYSISEVYSSMFDSLVKSKKLRQKNGDFVQSGRRSFTISETFHFKKWVLDQPQANIIILKQFLQNQYMQIIGSQQRNYQAKANYQDIINIYQERLMFLKKNLNYIPKITISNSFERTNLMILKLLGFQLILAQNQQINQLNTIKAKFPLAYGISNDNQRQFNVLINKKMNSPQFQFNNQQKCEGIYSEINRLQKFKQSLNDSSQYQLMFMNVFKNRLSNSYFNSVQKVMDQYGRQKCKKNVLSYANYRYFSQTLNFQKIQIINQSQFAQNYEDKFNSVEYYARKYSNYVNKIQKILFLDSLTNIQSAQNTHNMKILQNMKDLRLLLLRSQSNQKEEQQNINKITTLSTESNSIIQRFNQNNFPIQSINPIYICKTSKCSIPENYSSDILIKVISFEIKEDQQQKIQFVLPKGQFYQPLNLNITALNYFYKCQRQNDSCVLIIYTRFYTYTMIRLRKVYKQKLLQKIGYYINISQDQNLKQFKDKCQIIILRNKLQLSLYKMSQNNKIKLNLNRITRYSNPQQKRYKLQWSEGYISQLEINQKFLNGYLLSFQIRDKYVKLVIEFKTIEQQLDNHFFMDSNGLMQKRLNKSDNWKKFSSFVKVSLKNQYAFNFHLKNAITIGRVQQSGIIQIQIPNLLNEDFGTNFQLALTVSKIGQKTYQPSIFRQDRITQLNQIQQSKRISTFQPDWKQIKKWLNVVKNYDKIHFFQKIYDKTSGIITFVNPSGTDQISFTLFADNIIPMLTVFYGQVIKAASIQEVTIGGNILYADFIQNRKFYQYQNKTKEKEFFQTTFKEQIILKPYSIRSFKLTNLTIEKDCQSKINFTKKIINYQHKQAEKVQEFQTWEDIMKTFMANGNHCIQQSPVAKTFQMKKKIIKKEQVKKNQQKPNDKNFNKKDNIKIDQPTTTTDKKHLHIKQPSKSDTHQLTKQQEVSIQKAKDKKQQQSDSDKHFKVDQDQFSSIKQKIMRRQRIQRKQKFIYFKEKLLRIKKSRAPFPVV